MRITQVLSLPGITVAAAARGNPLVALATVLVIYAGYNYLEGRTDIAEYGLKIFHRHDFYTMVAVLLFSVQVVYCCARYNLARGGD